MATSFPTLLGLLVFAAVLETLRRRYKYAPFLLTCLMFFFFYFAMAESIFPFVVPPEVTIAAAAANPVTLEVMAVFFTIGIPIILIYNAHQHLVFIR